jgi:hypothetical protein
LEARRLVGVKVSVEAEHDVSVTATAPVGPVRVKLGAAPVVVIVAQFTA